MIPFAADYPLLEVLWTILILGLVVLWIFVVVWTLVDNFRRADHGGWAKAAWMFVIILLPFLGVAIYLMARPGLGERREVSEPVYVSPQERSSYVVGAAHAPAQADTADQLQKLADLKNQGVLSDDEFEAHKKKLLEG